MLKKLLLLSSVLLTSCAGPGGVFTRQASEPEWGIAQYQSEGDRKIFQVCARCPGPSPKTPWDGLMVATLGQQPIVIQNQASTPAAGAVEEKVGGLSDQAMEPVVVHFDFDSDVIKTDQRPKLDQLIVILADTAESVVTITGYTDDVGTEPYNDRLALRRAEAIASYLIRRGNVENQRIRVTGDGKCCFIADNDKESGRAMNRRAVAVVNIELSHQPEEETQ